MSCNFTEKVSQWIDGELVAEEAEQVQLHVSACAICQRAQEDFFLLREQISEYPIKRDHAAERRTLAGILGTERVPLWRRKVALPAPAFALVVLLIVALSAWMIATRATKSPLQTAVQSTNPAVEKPSAQTAKDNVDFSRFDRGERAVIYAARRVPTGNTQP
jgi:anti-sigma factor RsiW